MATFGCCCGCCATACSREIESIDVDVILNGVTNTYNLPINDSISNNCGFMHLIGKTCKEQKGEYVGGVCVTACNTLTDFSFTVTWSFPPPVDTVYPKIEINCFSSAAKQYLNNTCNADNSVQTNSWDSERYVGRFLYLDVAGNTITVDLTEGNTCYTDATIASRIKAALVAIGHPQITVGSISVSVTRNPMTCDTSLDLTVAQRDGTRVCYTGVCPAPETLPAQLTPPPQCEGGLYTEDPPYPFDIIQSNVVYSETIFTNSETRKIIGLIFVVIDGSVRVRPLYSKSYSVSTRTITKRQIITRHYYGQWDKDPWMCFKYQDTCETTVESDVTTTITTNSDCISYLTSSRTCGGEDGSGYFPIVTVAAGVCFSEDEYSCTTTWNDSGLTSLPTCGFTPLSTTYTTLPAQTITWKVRVNYA